MSFLESIQHGLEKASQEATRLARIQHLHNVTNDLNFKASQQGQNLVAKAMEMYHSGLLAQGELTAICKQIADYQQQLSEVQEELQRLHESADDADQQNIPTPPPPAYPPDAPGAVPPGYSPYPAPPAGYPAYPPQTAYPGAPAPAPSVRQPTQPLAAVSAPPAESDAPAQPQVEHHKASTRHHNAEAEAAPATADTGQPGTYAKGALPPIYSPFANSSAPAAAEAEPEKPAKAHHSEKKAVEKGNDAPAKKD